MEIRFIDMFCAIGGFRYGLEKSDGEHQEDTKASGCRGSVGNKGEQSDQSKKRGNYFSCVWSNDNDRYACQIYRKHFGEVTEADIRTVDASIIPEHDLLCAGFPCQSFSIAGKRGGFEDTRGTLFFEICRVIRAKRPSYLLLENVKGLLNHDDGSTFERIIGALDELGYDCQWQVLNSKDYGVPQNRERVFIIGYLRGKPRPKVFPIGETNTVYSEVATCLDSNYGKGWLDHGQRTMIYDVYNQGLRANQELAGALKGEGVADTSIGTAIVERTPLKYLNRNQKNIDGDWVFTIDSVHTGGIKQGTSIRRLTPLECERLQGFPDGWTEGISDTQRYKCLGNAVTVNVIEAIGQRLIQEIQ